MEVFTDKHLESRSYEGESRDFAGIAGQRGQSDCRANSDEFEPAGTSGAEGRRVTEAATLERKSGEAEGSAVFAIGRNKTHGGETVQCLK